MRCSRVQIYDFGMNQGEDTEYYLQKGFRVIAIEANPASCQRVAERLSRDIESGNLVILNKAIGDSYGKLPFFVCNEENARSTASLELVNYWTNEGETFSKIEVDFCSASEIISEYGSAHYIKVDIEGFDLVCISQIFSSGELPDYLSFEVDFKEIKKALILCRSKGYTQFALINQAKVSTTQDVIVRDDGSVELYHFGRGQTGRFGASLNAEWVNPSQIRRQLEMVKFQYRVATLIRKVLSWSSGSRKIRDALLERLTKANGWYDIHARRPVA
jgi:FkbM family methyltransferase